VPDYGIPYLRQPAVIDPVYGSIVFATPIGGHDEDFYGLLNRDFRRAKSDIGTVRVESEVLAAGLTLSNVTRYGRGGTQQVVSQSGRQPRERHQRLCFPCQREPWRRSHDYRQHHRPAR